MKWKRDDSYLEKTKGKAQQIPGKKGDAPLPWWWRFDALRPHFKTALWHFAVMFGASKERAEIGYKLGLIVGGHAYVGDEVLHHENAIIYIRRQNWIFFAVGLDGNVIPDEGGTSALNKEFWVDKHPENDLSPYLDGRNIVD